MRRVFYGHRDEELLEDLGTRATDFKVRWCLLRNIEEHTGKGQCPGIEPGATFHNDDEPGHLP